MKKINLLYIVWILLFVLAVWIILNLKTQGSKIIFGIAFTEHHSLNVEFATIVKERRIQPGDKVKKGDTLLILKRGELDKNIDTKLAAINQLEVESTTKNALLEKEIELFNANQRTSLFELQSKINVLEKEIEVQNNLLLSIGEKKEKKAKSIKEIQLDGLLEASRQINIQTAQRLSNYQVERQRNLKEYEAKLLQFKNEMAYYQQEQFKLNVISPCDGIIEDVFVLPTDIAQGYKELVRINSLAPNRVTGFVHEAMITPFNIGDTVVLVSAARPELSKKAIIIGSGNNLVELPLRLRKYAEIKAWGREIYIQMDPENDFYIGEKLLIQLN